jgi:hypothetical protein
MQEKTQALLRNQSSSKNDQLSQGSIVYYFIGAQPSDFLVRFRVNSWPGRRTIMYHDDIRLCMNPSHIFRNRLTDANYQIAGAAQLTLQLNNESKCVDTPAPREEMLQRMDRGHNWPTPALAQSVSTAEGKPIVAVDDVRNTLLCFASMRNLISDEVGKQAETLAPEGQ